MNLMKKVQGILTQVWIQKRLPKKYFEPYLKVARVCENMSDGC